MHASVLLLKIDIVSVSVVSSRGSAAAASLYEPPHKHESRRRMMMMRMMMMAPSLMDDTADVCGIQMSLG